MEIVHNKISSLEWASVDLHNMEINLGTQNQVSRAEARNAEDQEYKG